MEVLSKLANASSIPSINYGGCARYALELYTYLMKAGIKSTIVYCSSSWCEHEFELHKKKRVHSCSHAVVRINGKFYDGEGLVDRKYLYQRYTRHCPVTPEYVNETLSDESLWNSIFEMSNDNEGKKRIKNYLKEIFNSIV